MWALGACEDRSPLVVADAPAPRATAALRCHGDVRAARVECGAAAPGGARGDVLVGGQGTYLRLRSGPPAYDPATERFTFDVTLQNLLAQSMGTVDDSTVAGVKVFFHEQPIATSGAGEITVENADGYDVFTGTQQPYYLYPEILYPQGTSQPRTWTFTVPSTVQTFEFTLLVQTPLHSEHAPLRWHMLDGVSNSGTATVGWPATDTSGFAAGTSGYVLRYNGQSADRIPTRLGVNLESVWGSHSLSDAVVRSKADLYRYRGNAWTHAACPDTVGDLSGDTVSAVFAAGDSTLYRFNGTSCTALTTFPGLTTTDAWAQNAGHIAVVGTRSVIISGSTRQPRAYLESFDGTAWTETQIPVPFTSGPAYMVRVTPTDVVAAGGPTLFVSGNTYSGSDGSISYWVMYWNGSTWNQYYSSANTQLRLVTGRPDEAYGMALSFMRCSAAGCIKVAPARTAKPWVGPGPGSGWFLAGASSVARYDSAATFWYSYATPLREPVSDQAPTGTWALHALDESHVYAIQGGGLEQLNGTGWKYLAGNSFDGVWARSPAEVYAVGNRRSAATSTNEAIVSVYDGTAITATTGFGAATGQDDILWDVHGSGGTVMAVGFRSASANRGLIAQLTPGGWTFTATSLATSLNGVWVRGDTAAYAVGASSGRGVVLRWDGAAWTATTTGTSEGLADVTDVGGVLYAVGYRSTPAGQVGIIRRLEGSTWVLVKETGPRQLLRSVWGSSPSDVYAVGDAGTALHFNGSSWAYVDVPTANTLNTVSGTSATNVFIGGNNLSMYGRR